MILSSVLKLGKPQITHILTKNFIAGNIEVKATDQYRYFHDFSATHLLLCSEESLTLEMSALVTLYGDQFTIYQLSW